MTVNQRDQASEQTPHVPGTQTEAEPYRVLLPLDREGRRPGLLQFALALAEARGGEVIALHVNPTDEPESDDWTLPPLDGDHRAHVPCRVMNVRAGTIAEGILNVAREHDCDLVLLNWDPQPRSFRSRLGKILDPVLEDAPCTVALLKGDFVYRQNGFTTKRILLAAAGGPNAAEAARLAFALASACEGTVTLLSVLPKEASRDDEVKAQGMLDTLVAASPPALAEGVTVERKLVRAAKIGPAIVSEAKDHDLVLLGGTRNTILYQLFRGSIAEYLSNEIPQPVVIVKQYQGLTRYWLRRFLRGANDLLPSVSNEERLDTYKRVRRGARATFDFYTLILLSVVIATMGLLLNSGAVIIGAMLVAPLMTPILGIGLAVIMGDSRLLRIAIVSTIGGVLLAIGVATLLTWLAPLALFTTEVESRTQPNLFDLTVALAAGAAGAYSVSRKGVGAALPGVAIAAALVPPLSVVGIGLATARWVEAGGAMLLFTTNLVAITFSATVVYFLFGFLPQADEHSRHKLLRRGFVVSLLLLFLLSIPLSRSLEQASSYAALNRGLRDALQEVISQETDYALFNFEWDAPPDGPIQLRAIILARGAVPPATVRTIDDYVTTAVGQEINLRLVVIPISELRDVPESP